MKRFVAILTIFFVAVLLLISCAKGKSRTSGLSAVGSTASGEIEAYVPPGDVDAGVFEMLKDEFLRQLGNNPDRTSASAPMGEAGRVTDLAYDSGTDLLTWTYVNLGDYNLSGDVSIADVAEVARYYLADATDGAGDDPFEAWVDGSGDGEVNIADVAPLANNYLNEVSEYLILTSDTPDGTYTEIGSVDFSEAKVPSQTGVNFPKIFEVQLPGGALDFIYVQSADSLGAPGETGGVISLSGAGVPPVISRVTPSYGGKGAVVTFTADVSGTPPLNYIWNFGGGANPNTSTEASPTVTLGSGGDYAASLTVDNAFGEPAAFNFNLYVEGTDIFESSLSNAWTLQGASVTIYGTGFSDIQEDNHVYLGGIEQPLTWSSTTSMEFTVPSDLGYGSLDLYAVSAGVETRHYKFCIALTGTLSADMTFTADRSPYILTSDLTVPPGMTLTIEPGVVVKLDSWEHVYIDGALNAVGTSADRITFTSIRDDSVAGDTNGDGSGTIPGRGDWYFIRFGDSSDDANCELQYVDVRYGGYTEGLLNIYQASPTITNTTLSDSATAGIYIEDGSPVIGKSTFIDCESYAVDFNNKITSNPWPIIAFNSYISNSVGTRWTRAISYDSVLPAGTEAIWRDDVVHYIESDLTIEQDATLTIKPGTVVKFGTFEHMYVDGALNAVGTTENPITFTSIRDDSADGDTNDDGSGTTPSRGDWYFIKFDDTSDDAASLFDHVDVRYGGYTEGLVHIFQASPTIVNSTFSESATTGIFIENGSPMITGNSFIDCDSFAIDFDYNLLIGEWPDVHDNTYVSNAADTRWTRAIAYEAVLPAGTSYTWGSDAVHYIESDLTIEEGAMLTIEPGTVVKLGTFEHIYVDGALSAVGTPEDLITITSIRDDSADGDTNNNGNDNTPSRGDWYYIQFGDSSDDANSRLEYVDVRYGGYTEGLLYIFQASPTIMNSTLSESATTGIFIENGSPTITGNSFIDFDSFAIDFNYNLLIGEWPDVHDNMYVSNATDTRWTRAIAYEAVLPAGTSYTWGNDVVHYIESDLTIEENAMLTIEPGTVVKLGTFEHIYVDGALSAVGTPADRITITSIRDDSADGDTNNNGNADTPSNGDWYYIQFDATSDDANCRLEYVDVHYGGYTEGLLYITGASPTAMNSDFGFSGTWGIYIFSGSPTLVDNTYHDNTDGDVGWP